jgi:hypothetical protein
MANPIPVLPEVGSTSVVVPGAMSPRFSASRIMLLAIRSLTELAGFWLSSLHTNWAPQSEEMRFSWTRGVFPISSKTLAAILGGGGGTEEEEEALMVERRWKIDAMLGEESTPNEFTARGLVHNSNNDSRSKGMEYPDRPCCCCRLSWICELPDDEGSPFLFVAT